MNHLLTCPIEKAASPETLKLIVSISGHSESCCLKVEIIQSFVASCKVVGIVIKKSVCLKVKFHKETKF